MEAKSLAILLLAILAVSSLKGVWSYEDVDVNGLEDQDVVLDELDKSDLLDISEDFFKRKKPMCRVKSTHYVDARCIKPKCRQVCQHEGYTFGKCSKSTLGMTKKCFCMIPGTTDCRHPPRRDPHHPYYPPSHGPHHPGHHGPHDPGHHGPHYPGHHGPHTPPHHGPHTPPHHGPHTPPHHGPHHPPHHTPKGGDSEAPAAAPGGDAPPADVPAGGPAAVLSVTETPIGKRDNPADALAWEDHLADTF